MNVHAKGPVTINLKLLEYDTNWPNLAVALFKAAPRPWKMDDYKKQETNIIVGQTDNIWHEIKKFVVLREINEWCHY